LWMERKAARCERLDRESCSSGLFRQIRADPGRVVKKAETWECRSFDSLCSLGLKRGSLLARDDV